MADKKLAEGKVLKDLGGDVFAEMVVAVNLAGTDISGGGGGSDTEFPAAAALSDTLANPTTPQVGSSLLLWDGTQWVRGRGDVANGLDVDVTRLPAPFSAALAAADIHAPAANTAAVVTYAAAGAGVSHVIAGVAWSYNSAPTGGNLKIEDVSGTTVLSLDITAAGPGFIPFPVPLKGDANAALIVTLAAGGAAATGKVSVLGHWTV